MKKQLNLLSIVSIFFLVSCGSSQKNTQSGIKGDKEIILPCTGPEYRTDDNNIRSTMYSISTDMGMAKTKALASARAELATSINAIIERTNDDYSSSYQSGEQEEARRKMNDMARTIVKETISDSRIICEKMMQTEDGKYRCYVTVQTPKDNILGNMKNKLMKDEKLRLDFEYEKYKKIFDEEMKKLDDK